MDPRSNQHQLARRKVRLASFPPLVKTAPTPLLLAFLGKRFAGLPRNHGEEALGLAPYVNWVRTQTTNYYMTLLFNCQALSSWRKFGDPYRIRTDVNGVRGRCLNHLTNGPRRRDFSEDFSEPGVSPGYTQLRTGAPSRTRTGDPLIKSQLLYQLS